MIQHKTFSTQQPGFILVTVVLTLTILASLAFMLSRQSAINTDGVVREHQPDTSRYVAEAGYNHAVWQLNRLNCTGYTDISNSSFGNHSYTVAITDAAGSPLTGGSPAKISATGSLVDGISRSLMRENVKIYQTPTTTILQPGAADGKDAYLWYPGTTNNYGSVKETWVSTMSNDKTVALYQFDLAAIAAGAKILSATLSLLHWQGWDSNVPISAHRITNAWNETEVSWDNRTSTQAWDSPAGDFDPEVIDLTLVGPASQIRYEWQLKSVVEKWISGSQPNYGVLLRTSAPNIDGERFYTSDDSDPTRHPRLTIIYACECGQTCNTTPTDKIILSTRNVATLASLNFEPTDLAEYAPVSSTASLYFDGSTTSLISEIDAIHVLANNNILLSTKDNTSFGGLSFNDGDIIEYDPNTNLARLYFAETAFSADEDIKSLYLMDNGHVLLSTDSDATLGSLSFTANDLVEYDLSNDTATLYFDGSSASLTGNIDAVHLLENNHIVLSTMTDDSLGGLNFKDGDLVDYNPLTDTAVMYFEENLFTDDEDVQSVHIGAGSGTGLAPFTAPIAHWKLDETSGITAVDSVGGHDGTLNNGPTWATGQLDGGLNFDGVNDAIHVPHADTLSLTDAMTFIAWVNATSYGSSFQTILAKDAGGSGSNYWFGTFQQDLSFGFWSGGVFREIYTTGLNLQAGTWYQLAATFDNATDEVRLYVNGVQVHSGTLAFSPSAVTADLTIGRSPDVELWRGLLDDVRIYNSLLPASEIAELYNIGSGLPPPVSGSCDGTFRDEFINPVYSGNDGTLNWTGDWQEINESNGPTSGDERVFADLYEDPPMPTYQLHVRDNDGGGEGVMRALDLSGATTATLSFDYKPAGLDNSNDYASVQMSTTGSAGPWTEIVRFAGPASETAYQPYSTDISSYISENAVLRIITSPNMGNNDYLFFDNIQIQCNP